MPLTSRRCRAAVGAASAALALTLTACSPSTEASPAPTATDTAAPIDTPTPEATPTETPTPTPVPVSDSIDGFSVVGEFGQQPALAFVPPFAIDETRSRVLIEGPSTAPVLAEDSIIEVHYEGHDARTGTKFDSSWDKGGPTVMSLQGVVPGFTKGLVGKKVGDRVLIVMPGADGYDSAGGNPQAGIEVGDSLVFVVDVLASSVDTATGETLSPALPVTLGTDDGGHPTVAIPAGAAQPTQRVVETVIRGDQRGVAETDLVMVHYRAYSWRTGALIEDKFDQPDVGQLSSTIADWQEGLVGVPIGSRVVLVAPDPYPTGNQSPAIEAGDSVVYVIDVLFASSVAG
ncbi:MAG: FKBP-type peptidyl-prolyl cis-trans isomerase [Propionibacteriaceae bacterium]|nr:FKBP-type peptidyl-prolyl cis-trans isomerase [Propionibacteriaceae bacterium]